MPAPERGRALPQVLAALLAAQLGIAAGAVVGPWAVQRAPVDPVAASRVVPAAPPRPGSGLAVGAARSRARPAPVLSAAMWAGAVRAAPLGLTADGELRVPGTAGGLGWWADGPLPGEQGAAVVVGHVDLDGHDGVFARLASARRGAVVEVVLGETVVRYRVTGVERFAKTAFPTDRVYAPSARRELRLVTCGGRFDRTTGHYRDNVVVTAVAEEDLTDLSS